MTEGTKSYLIGCHQFFLHPLWVLLAWRLEYKSWPKWWEIISIFLHDCGICGRQYLSDDKAKIGHWEKGADLSFKVVWHLGQHRRSYLAYRSHDLVAGHCPEESGYCESRLSRADKRSWLVAPMWWKWCNYWVEWSGKGIGVTPPHIWTKLVRENLKRTKPLGNHELYLRNRKRLQVREKLDKKCINADRTNKVTWHGKPCHRCGSIDCTCCLSRSYLNGET